MILELKRSTFNSQDFHLILISDNNFDVWISWTGRCHIKPNFAKPGLVYTNFHKFPAPVEEEKG